MVTERKWLISCSPWEFKKHPKALIYDEDVAPRHRHVPAETLGSEWHSWASHTQENMEKQNFRDIYALEKTSKGYGLGGFSVIVTALLEKTSDA